MRQLAYATALGLTGALIAAIAVRLIANGSDSLSENWLVAGAVLPVIGVVLGAFLSHRMSNGADPWPITTFSQRIPFDILGGLLGAFTWYLCYVSLSAMWNGGDVFSMLLHPSSITALSSAEEGKAAEDAPLLLYVGIGLVAGAWVTDTALRRKWTS